MLIDIAILKYVWQNKKKVAQIADKTCARHISILEFWNIQIRIQTLN